MNKAPAGSFYRHILRDAWSITARNPVLWIFGFFVSFLGNGGVYEMLIQGTGKLGLTQDFGGYVALAGLVPSGPNLVNAARQLGAMTSAGLVLLALGVIGLAAAAVWVVVSSQAALIVGVRDVQKGRKPAFGRLFTAGSELFPPVFALDVLSRIAVTACFYLLLSMLVLLLSRVTVASALLYLLAFLILIPLTLIIGFVTVYAAGYVALHRMRVVEAIESAVALFRKYWLISLETAVILFACNILVAMALIMALFILAAVFFLGFGYVLLASGVAAWVLLVVGIAVAMILLVATGAGLAAFQYAVWTALFIRLNQRGYGAMSKLARWFHRLFGK